VALAVDPVEAPTASPEPTAAAPAEAPTAGLGSGEPTPVPTAEPTPQTLTAVGDPIEIRWGMVQVAVTVSGDRIVDVETLDIPLGDRRSQRINERAEPILREEALARNSADIDVVSGATYTSQAYAFSLQSALDQLSG
jgi:uncharacterized protein with FMN-binding domain